MPNAIKQSSMARKRVERELVDEINRLLQLSSTLTSHLNQHHKSPSKKKEMLNRYKKQLSIVDNTFSKLHNELGIHDREIAFLDHDEKFNGKKEKSR